MVVGLLKIRLLLWGGLLVLWVLSLSLLARRPLAVFFLDAYTLAYLFIPLALTQGVLRAAFSIPWTATWRAIGIPLGLLLTLIGDAQIGANADNAEGAYMGMGLNLTAVVWGGAISALGHFLHREGSKAGEEPYRLGVLLLASSSLGLTTAIAAYLGFSWLVSLEGLLLFLSLFLTALVVGGGRGPLQEVLPLSALFAAVVQMAIGLVFWYAGSALDQNTFLLTVSGLLLGLWVYTVSLPWLLLEEGFRERNHARFSWHWIEVVSFITFMLFAPQTLLEQLRASEVAEPPQVRGDR